MKHDLNQLVKDWTWLFDASDYTLLAIYLFGDLLLRDKSAAIHLLDAPALAAIPFNCCRYRLTTNCCWVSQGRFCYGYNRQLVAGASMEAKNVYVVTMPECVSFMGNFHEQIQDVADGEKVTLKVVNQRILQ